MPGTHKRPWWQADIWGQADGPRAGDMGLAAWLLPGEQRQNNPRPSVVNILVNKTIWSAVTEPCNTFVSRAPLQVFWV